MATKTFKIGLSNTDKQNMAQDVYERLLALTFPEYDSAESYDVGDFVVYNDQLYKCIGATTGAWDSTKWQLATLNDLLTDIEDAVAFVNDKANVDGNYPTMTVGVADNLSPYDEESGIKQHAPFNFQASGTNNGTDPTATVGALAIMSEKRGNSVVVNQEAKELNATNYLFYGATGSFSDGIATFTASQQNGQVYTVNNKAVKGHKYFMSVTIKLTTGTTLVGMANGNEVIFAQNTTNWQTLYGISEWLADQNYMNYPDVRDQRTSDWDAIQVKDFICIDLTQWFNGDIPQDLLDSPSNFFRYYQGSLAYNEGTLVNANSRYLKAIGRNQWDEETELGGISVSTGQETSSSTTLRSKNYIRVNPNVEYYGFMPSSLKSSGIYVYWYDKDKNFITAGLMNTANGFIHTAPSNAIYLRLVITDTYGTTYNHDITISLYYEGESGYDKYYPYELLTNNDTGTEVLRSAGSVYDSKTPDGTITRRVGSYTFTGSEVWTQFGACYYSTVGTSAKSGADTKNAISSIGLPANNNQLYDGQVTNAYNLNANNVYISADLYANISNLTGKTIYYELAEPTTEQGTPYSENIAIDDFGSMDFSGTSGVPQGNALFYLVDYKAYLDTLHNYTDGDPANLALKSDLTPYDDKDTQLLNAIGGTLRQLLATSQSIDFLNTNFVDLGTLNWQKRADGLFSLSTLINELKTAGKILCSKYNSSSASYDTLPDLSITSYDNFNNHDLIIKDSSYTDVTALTNSLKGVLLAYEKA